MGKIATEATHLNHRVQFASDLHLEFEHSPSARLELPIARGTTALVLAGDIHSDLHGIDRFARPLARRVPVILVAGNHEYFTNELNEHRERLHDWASAIPNVHFLENDTVELDGLTFLGCTLWSNFRNADPALMKKAPSMMTDYAVIADGEGPRSRLRPERVLAEHRQSIAFLARELAARDPAHTVVVTHHAPSLRSSRCKGEDWDCLYGSDLDALIEDHGPAAWIHGHVHESFDYRIGRTRVLCNPRGYPRYEENARFDPSRSVPLRNSTS